MAFQRTRKLLLVAIVVGAILLTTELYRQRTSSIASGLSYEDIREIISKSGLSNWYNYTKIRKWYNGKSVSMLDPRILTEIRTHWIISNVDKFTDYSGLARPQVVDPSMGQAQVVREIFNNKKNGFFIECGAYDGETRSNTLNLERYYNWTGILIEADIINFSKLLGKRRRAYLSPTCLSTKKRPMNVSFLMADNIGRIHEPEDSVDPQLSNNGDVAHFGSHIPVQCFPLVAYIAALNIEAVDYFSLDVEGSEMEVLQTIPFDSVDIKTLSVEYTHVPGGYEEMIKYMEVQGYYVYSFVNNSDNLANDVIFVKRNFPRHE